MVTRAARELDLTTHLAKQTVSLTVQNTGERPLSSLLYTVETSLADKLAFIGAQTKVEEEDVELKVTPTTIAGKAAAAAYRIDLPSPLAAQQQLSLEVETVFTHAVVPYPSEITQAEKQLVQFSSNAHVFLPYPTRTQSTTVTLPSSSIESFTRVSPVSTNENEINYGPYSDLPAFSHAKILLHFENNGPFIKVASLERLIEVSHWGNVAVEEHYHITHFGAKLKGSFSRYDYQRIPTSGQSSVKSYKTMLPAAARDVYYRDEIGNISTSHLREAEDYVELELRPRFPLFGGWQTRYYIGYNVPSYEYLYHSGSRYMLRMRFVDHAFDEQIIESVTVRVVLPEGARNIALKPPYPVTERPTELRQTYLDTVGRPVVVITKNNVVEQHIQDFELYYDFETILLLQEPLLVVAALYLFFLLVIAIVRMDFTITKDAALLAKQQASVLVESILQAHDRRSTLITGYQDAIATYKQSKDNKAFKASKRRLDEGYRSSTEDITSKSKELQGTDSEATAKVNELQKKSAELKAILEESCILAERVVSERIGKQQYLEQDKSNQQRINRLQQDIDSLVQTLGM